MTRETELVRKVHMVKINGHHIPLGTQDDIILEADRTGNLGLKGYKANAFIRNYLLTREPQMRMPDLQSFTPPYEQIDWAEIVLIFIIAAVIVAMLLQCTGTLTQ